jgi:hypothetical protein
MRARRKAIGCLSECYKFTDVAPECRSVATTPASVSVKPYDFRYMHGNLFTKEVNIDIDYSGELFENHIDKIVKFIEEKNEDRYKKPNGDI